MINKELLFNMAKEQNIILSEKHLNLFDSYAKTLLEWNEKINLTAITQPDEIVVKHFIDSLLLLNTIDIKPNSSLIDIGTGAGFPSVPIKIVREDISITLLDSLKKRVNFLEELCFTLNMKAVYLHSRAEEAGAKTQYREAYDIATARAVAKLRELAEYCLPFVKVGGVFVAFKGYDIEDEVAEAQKAIFALGGEILGINKYSLGKENKRALVVIKKISQTPTIYPRTSAKIAKSPL